jgi:hypothetical protein
MTKLLAIVISFFIVLVLIAESFGRGPGVRMTSTEMLLLALSIPGIWLGYLLTRWWTGFLNERGF